MQSWLVSVLLVQYFFVHVRSENVNNHDKSTSETSRDEDDRIIGGTAALKGMFPWQVKIAIWKNNHEYSSCGGSIIAPRWILTAAHCTDGASMFVITVSANNLKIKEPGVTTYVTDLVHTHSDYNNVTVENDIALIELRTPIFLGRSTSLAEAINLPRLSDVGRSFEEVPSVVSGWGRTKDGGPVSSVLNYVILPVISNEECNNDYNKASMIIQDSMICTSARNGTTTTCQGDSGGPLVYTEHGRGWTQIGIVSFGYAKCEEEQSSVYTRVTSFLYWISYITHIPIQH